MLDRRRIDRRAVYLETIASCPFEKACASLRNLDLPLLAFPGLEIIRRNTITRNKYVIDWRANFTDGSLHIQTEVEIGSQGRFLSFRQLKGDFQLLQGTIELMPAENGVKIITSVIIEPGLPSFEAFMGDVFKGKIRGVVKTGLERAAAGLGGVIPNQSDFGFLVHTIPDYFSTTFSDTSYARMTPPLTKYLLRQLPPFKCSYVTGVKSLTGATIKGNLIYSPFAPSHFLELGKDFLLQHMIEAAEIAKDLGAKIIGLGAYTAFVGKRGLDIASAVQMPVTTGTCYTIATALRAMEKAAANSGLALGDATVMIVGATGSIGRACAELLCSKVGKLILVARNLSRLKDLMAYLNETYKPTKITYTNDLNMAFAESDLALMSTNTPDTLVDLSHVKPGTIICDISQPRNVSPEDAALREDILVIDGGVVDPPGNPNFNFYFGLPPGLAFACMAETMILALEKKYESFSIGGNITARKISEIEELGDKHGFKLARLKSFGHEIKEECFERIASARKLCNAV